MGETISILNSAPIAAGGPTYNPMRMAGKTPRWLWSQVFLGSAQRKLFERGVPILAYHSVGDAPAGITDPYLYVSEDRFDGQLAQLRNAGFSSAQLDQLGGSDPDQRHRVIITFDDGYRSVFEHAMDVLARHRFHAVQFVVSDLIGGRNEWMIAKGDLPEPLMDRAQIREWLAAGHQIGSHSATHAKLRRLPLAKAREEIIGSKKRLEDLFGIPVNHFSYPFGEYNDAVRDVVAEAGYHTACTIKFGVNTAETPRRELRRIIPLSASELVGKIQHRARTWIKKRCLNARDKK
jgi:peptidoglycan/xylan/chitin deacetylase (PgdA/CDA1 family)